MSGVTLDCLLGLPPGRPYATGRADLEDARRCATQGEPLWMDDSPATTDTSTGVCHELPNDDRDFPHKLPTSPMTTMYVALREPLQFRSLNNLCFTQLYLPGEMIRPEELETPSPELAASSSNRGGYYPHCPGQSWPPHCHGWQHRYQSALPPLNIHITNTLSCPNQGCKGQMRCHPGEEAPIPLFPQKMATQPRTTRRRQRRVPSAPIWP